MTSRSEIVEHYLQKKLVGELDLSQIKKELQGHGDLSEEEINSITREISDRELAEVTSKTKPAFSFLNHISISYIMVVVCLAVIALSGFFLYWLYTDGANLNLGRIYQISPYAFIGAAVILLGKHMIRIRQDKWNRLSRP